MSATVIFSNVRSDHLIQRHHYVARWRASVERTVWVETLGSRSPRPADVRRLGGEGAAQTVDALLPGVEVLGPGTIPLHSRLVYPLNRRRLARRLRSHGIDAGQSTAWVYLPHPVVVDLLRGQRWKRVVYDCVDDVEDMAVHPSLVPAERELLRAADIVFATSKPLAEKARRIRGGEVHYVPNGVDAERFGELAPPRPKVDTLLYIGAIYEWLDEDLIAEVAERRPDLTIRLVGPQRRRLRRLRSLENVVLAGPVPAARVAAEIAAADVCIIPFRSGPLSTAADPLKVYEALMVGRPVLATDLPQAARFSPSVRMESDADGWLRALHDLESGRWTYDPAAMRTRVMADEDWRQRFSAMQSILDAQA